MSYSYANDELALVNDGGLQDTRYAYERHALKTGSQSISLTNIIFAIMNPVNWVSVIEGLIPAERNDAVYYLSEVTTPYQGKYRLSYTEYKGIYYASDLLSCSIMWYEFGKVTGFKELGSAYQKEMRFDYVVNYVGDQKPTVMECNVYEGDRRTWMIFDHFSNAVDEDISMLSSQYVYGKGERILSSHLVEYDKELEAPVKVVDQTGGRGTTQEFRYDNWGNVVWQRNSKTNAESFYTYANTDAPPINHPRALASPYGRQSIAAEIHDARTGELVLNQNAGVVVPQQTYL